MTSVITQPKLLTLQTPCIRNGKTLVWLQKQSHTNWSAWDAVVTSLEEYHKWSNAAHIVGIILDRIPSKKQEQWYEDLYAVSSYVPIIMLSSAILQTKSQEYWADNYDNVMCIEQLTVDYPFLGKPWDKTKEDAVALFAYLSRYYCLIDCMSTRTIRESFTLTLKQNVIPPQVWMITQYFRHPDEERANEIRTCLQKNVQCKDVSRIILLTEKDVSKDWSYTSKIQQVIIKRRLTYAHVLQFIKERVPKNTIVILANADIFVDDVHDLWKMNLEHSMLSLLRWDIRDPDDLDTAQLFGPRADSQDTWVLLSDSVKEIDWKYEPFDVQLGQPGCDNIFAGLMLQNHFVLYNPALTLRTYHYHETQIRNYTKADALRASVYVNIVPSYLIDTKQDTIQPFTTFSAEPVEFKVKSSSLSNEITYCTMLEKDGRYKWEPSVENYYFAEHPVYRWKHACVTPTGLVYTPYTIYPGDDTDYPYWKSSTVTIYTPLQRVKQMIAIPLPDMSVFSHRASMILYYLSCVMRFLKLYPEASFWIPEAYLSCLDTFSITSKPLLVSDDTAAYAEEVIGFLPGAYELGKEEIALLREHTPSWKPLPVYKRCIVIGDFHHRAQWNELLCKEWFVEYVEEATTDVLSGAALCIVGPNVNASTIWSLPKQACVVEFQQELEVHGTIQHLAHISEVRSYVLLLSKGSYTTVQKHMIRSLTTWFIAHEDEIKC